MDCREIANVLCTLQASFAVQSTRDKNRNSKYYADLNPWKRQLRFYDYKKHLKNILNEELLVPTVIYT